MKCEQQTQEKRDFMQESEIKSFSNPPEAESSHQNPESMIRASQEMP